MLETNPIHDPKEMYEERQTGKETEKKMKVKLPTRKIKWKK